MCLKVFSMNLSSFCYGKSFILVKKIICDACLMIMLGVKMQLWYKCVVNQICNFVCFPDVFELDVCLRVQYIKQNKLQRAIFRLSGHLCIKTRDIMSSSQALDSIQMYSCQQKRFKPFTWNNLLHPMMKCVKLLSRDGFNLLVKINLIWVILEQVVLMEGGTTGFSWLVWIFYIVTSFGAIAVQEGPGGVS